VTIAPIERSTSLWNWFGDGSGSHDVSARRRRSPEGGQQRVG